MRILWFTHRDFQHPSAGGAERTTYEISRRLVVSGETVDWISCSYPGSQSNTVIDGVGIWRVGNPATSHFKVRSLIREHNPDVIVDDLAHVVPWFSEWVTGIPGTVFFRHLHSRTLAGQVSPPLALALTLIEDQYAHIYRRWPFVTESEQGVEDLATLGIPLSRVVRIPPGVDLARFHPGEKFADPTIVYFGGFRDYKRPWIAISVFDELRRRLPTLRLLMLGDGPNRARIERGVPRGISSGVEFLGKLQDTKLAETVSKAWLNLHTSTAEGWGLSIMEAAAAGTPTAAFAVPGVTESIRANVTGLVVKDGDTRALAESAYRILSADSGWSAQSRQHALAFSWETAASRWHQHLEKVASKT